MEPDMQVVIRPRTVILIPGMQTPHSATPRIQSSEESAWRNYFKELGRLGGQKTSDRKRRAARLNAYRRWARVRQNKAAAMTNNALTAGVDSLGKR